MANKTISVLDQLAIADLLADHWERVDRVTEELITDLFTLDAKLQIGTLSRHGQDDIDVYARERRAAEDRSGRRTRHAMSNLRLSSQGSDEVCATFLLIVFAGTGDLPFASGPPSNIADFRATLRKNEGRWRISHLGGTAIFAGDDAPANAR